MGGSGPTGGNPFEGLPFFGDLAKMLASSGPIHWDAARQFALATATGGTAEGNPDPIERIKLEELARVAELLAEANANVIEVLHTRHGSGLQISEVELQLSVETRGPDHRAALVEMLRRAGYDPKIVDGE